MQTRHLSGGGVAVAPVIVGLVVMAGIIVPGVVMPGVVMAEGSILGANSFLKTSTEPWTIYAGSPARPIARRPSEIMKHNARELGYDY